MHRLRESIDIDAPVEVVWAAVHRDIAGVSRWSKNLVRTEVVGDHPVGPGSDLLYVARIPGGLTHDLRLHIERYDELRLCSGTVAGAALQGMWRWTYRMRGGTTHVVYETEVELRGRLRWAGPVIAHLVVDDVRINLDALKRHVETAQRRSRPGAR